MSDTRTNAELQAVVYQAMNDPLCQACLAQHECDSEHPLCEQALDELVRRADRGEKAKREAVAMQRWGL